MIIISVDLMRYDHLSCYGYGRKTSPNIDTLAASGCVFMNNYSQSPLTLPAHMAMFTSLRYHGVYLPFKDRLDPSIKTLAEIMKDNGFRTAFFGNIVPHLEPGLGFGRGFEVFEKDAAGILSWIEEHRDESFFTFLFRYKPDFPYNPPDDLKGVFNRSGAAFTGEEEIKRGLYSIMRERFIQDESYFDELLGADFLLERPVLFRGEFSIEKVRTIESRVAELGKWNELSVFYDAFWDSFNRSQTPEQIAVLNDVYDEVILGVDREIGLIKKKLEENGILKKTLIIITSGHGELLGEHGILLKHGETLYEEEVHVPLIICSPFCSGKKISTLTENIDIVPTVLEIFGIPVPDQVEGTSLLPVLMSADGYEHKGYVLSYKPRGDMIRKGRWKLIWDGNTASGMLFDLKTDPGESIILSGQKPEQVREMKEEMFSRVKQAEINRNRLKHPG